MSKVVVVVYVDMRFLMPPTNVILFSVLVVVLIRYFKLMSAAIKLRYRQPSIN